MFDVSITFLKIAYFFDASSHWDYQDIYPLLSNERTFFTLISRVRVFKKIIQHDHLVNMFNL